MRSKDHEFIPADNAMPAGTLRHPWVHRIIWTLKLLMDRLSRVRIHGDTEQVRRELEKPHSGITRRVDKRMMFVIWN